MKFGWFSHFRAEIGFPIYIPSVDVCITGGKRIVKNIKRISSKQLNSFQKEIKEREWGSDIYVANNNFTMIYSLKDIPTMLKNFG